MRQLKAKAVSPVEHKKLAPLVLVFFCILFNYTILRDTKHVLLALEHHSDNMYALFCVSCVLSLVSHLCTCLPPCTLPLVLLHAAKSKQTLALWRSVVGSVIERGRLYTYVLTGNMGDRYCQPAILELC